MRILMAGWETPYMFEYGGLSTFNKHLIKALLGMGHEVLWVGLHPDPGARGMHRTDMRGYTIYVLDTPGTLDTRRDLPRVWARLSDVEGLLGDIDLLLIHDFHLSPIAMYAARYDVDVRTYLHVVSMEPVEAMAVQYSSHVYTNSRLMRDGIVAPYVHNVFSSINRNPVDVDVVYPAPPSWEGDVLEAARLWRDWARRQYEELGGDINALVFGRNQDNKTTPHLFDAIDKLWGRGVKIGLVVAGRGWPEYRRGWLRMMGELPEDKKLALMMEADLFILPSRFEPFGMVVLEAMEMGVKHMTLSRYSGAAEVVDASVFEPDSTESIIGAVMEALGREAAYREWYRGWSWGRVAEELVK